MIEMKAACKLYRRTVSCQWISFLKDVYDTIDKTDGAPVRLYVAAFGEIPILSLTITVSK